MTKPDKDMIKYEIRRQQIKRRRRLVVTFAGAVVLISAIALMVPALSMTRQTLPAGTVNHGYVAGSIEATSALMPAQSFQQTISGENGEPDLTIYADAPQGAFPAGTQMQASTVETGQIEQAIDEALSKKGDGQVVGMQAANITFLDPAGNEIEPILPITVRFASQQIAQNEQPFVVHVDDAGEAEVMQALDESELTQRGQDSEKDQVVIDSSQFSVYAVVYTVDFHFVVDGASYDFSISGGDSISLGQLVEALGIVGPESSARKDSATAPKGKTPNNIDAFLASVESVEFTSPELLHVVKLETDTRIGDYLWDSELHVVYPPGMTQQQVLALNGKTYKAGDWVLVSLQPFTSDEALTITLKNGESVVVKVTDAQGVALNSDGTVQTIANPAGTTIDLFDYWILSDRSDGYSIAGRDGWGDLNQSWGGEGHDDVNGLNGTGNNKGINSSNSDADHGHALKFSPAWEGTIVNGTKSGEVGANGQMPDWWNGDPSWHSINKDGRNGLNSYTGGTDPFQGIVKSQLDGGYPVLTENNQIGSNGESLAYLFNPAVDNAGKASYPDVNQLLYVDKDGYYVYDSRNYAASFDKEGKTFTLNDQPAGSEGPTKGFWPFGLENYWFGMHVNTQFSMPVNGEVLNPQGEYKPMQFEFSGDDDVWIYVDGVLIGDAGGIHNRTEVDINFKTGNVTVGGQNQGTIRHLIETAKQTEIAAFTPEQRAEWDSQWDGQTFASGTYHTFDMFYLERGGYESNLYIKYNLVSTADFTAHKALYDQSEAGQSNLENILKRDQFGFQLVGLDGQYQSVERNGSYVIEPVEGQGNHEAIMPLGVELNTTDVALSEGATVNAQVCSTGVSEDGNVNFGYANISEEEKANCNAGHPSVYRYIILEDVPDEAVNADGHAWGDLKTQGAWSEMANGGFTAIDPMTGGTITYGATTADENGDLKTYSPVRFMAARVSKWHVKDASGNYKYDFSGKPVYEYGLSKTYYKDDRFFEVADNETADKFIDIRNGWSPGVGDVEFQKITSKGEPLKGAEFTLYADYACDVVATDVDGDGHKLVAKSDADGKVSFSGIRAGTYYMKETKAPDGYELDDAVYKVYVANRNDKEMTSKITLVGDASEAPITNIANSKPGEITVVKKWLDSAGNQMDAPADSKVFVKLKRKHYVALVEGEVHTVKLVLHIADPGWGDDYKNIYVEKEAQVAGDAVVEWYDCWQAWTSIRANRPDGSEVNYTLHDIDENGHSRKLHLSDLETDVTVQVEYQGDKAWLYQGDKKEKFVNPSIEGQVLLNVEDDELFNAQSTPVPIDASTSWIASWQINDGDSSALPSKDVDGRPYLYYVAECDAQGAEYEIGGSPHEGYELSGYDNNDGINEKGIISVFNKSNRSVMAQVELLKVDANTQTSLSGAKFYLQKDKTKLLDLEVCSLADDSPTIALDSDGCFEVPVSGALIKGLEPGTYTLVETAAPDGYVINSESCQFTVEADGSIAGDQTIVADGRLTIPNTPGSELPVTGGPGTTAFTLGGAALVLLAVVLLRARARKRA